MVKIAIAGATSGIGLAFRQRLDTQHSHEYVVLVRAPIENDPKTVLVDYTSIATLVHTLRSQSVHTVISALSIGDEASGLAQLNLIEAAIQSGCVRRFLPSEFGADYTERTIVHAPSYAYKLRARDLLAQSPIEYSIVSIGVFLDYWSPPRIPSSLDLRKGAALFISPADNFAAIPGDGSKYLVMTHSNDVARFVVAMLDLQSWPQDCFLAGDRLTLAEFLSQAEKAKDVKFEVHRDSLEKIQAGEVTLMPSLEKSMPLEFCKPFMRELDLVYLQSGFDLAQEKCRNDILPDGKCLKVQDVLSAWKNT